MPYFIFSIVALVIHVLINFNTFTKKDNVVAMKNYRLFLISIAAFFITDLIWGFFAEFKNGTGLYVSTIFYFLAMASTVFLWSIFVVRYLNGNRLFSICVKVLGLLFLISYTTLLIVNFFTPMFFMVDDNEIYHALIGRDVMFYIQIALYALVALYTVEYTIKSKTKNYKRHITIALFSIIMIICIAVQINAPYIPYYPTGCLIGVCLLDIYALNEQKEEFKSAYQEESKQNEKNKEKLDVALTLAYKDPLTGVKNKHAFVEIEEEYDKLITNKEVTEFSVIVFDLNGLKIINDTYGHDAGDKYIVDSVSIISTYFPHDSIYRFGGDEFVVIIKDNNNSAQKNHDDFMKEIEDNLGSRRPVVASGISRFKPDNDNTFKAVFYRADKMMYARKEYLKERK